MYSGPLEECGESSRNSITSHLSIPAQQFPRDVNDHRPISQPQHALFATVFYLTRPPFEYPDALTSSRDLNEGGPSLDNPKITLVQQH